MIAEPGGTKIESTSPQPKRRGDFPSVMRIPVFFAGCGAILGATTLTSIGVILGLESGWRRGSLFFGSGPSWGIIFAFMAIVGGVVGAFWVGICSLGSIHYLRRSRLWGRTTWLLPAHCLGIVAAEYILVSGGSGRGGGVVWFPLLVGGASFVFFYVLDRRRLPRLHVPGFCDQCEYDLTGNTSGVCPECGTETTEEDLAWSRLIDGTMWRSRLRELAAIVHSIDYESPESVAEHNAAATEIRELVRAVGCSSTAKLDELLSFLPDEVLGGWIAHCVLRECPTTSSQRNRCVSVIRNIAREEGPDATAARWWLRDNNEES